MQAGSGFRRFPARRALLGIGSTALLAAASVAAATSPIAAGSTMATLTPQAIAVPHLPGVFTTHADASTACVLPDGSDVSWFHCYTPQQIRTAYGVDSVTHISAGGPHHVQQRNLTLVHANSHPSAASATHTSPRT